MKKLKYQEEIDSFEPDLSNFAEQERPAYRFRFEDDHHPNNYSPVYLITKSRPRNIFHGWGLSLYDTQEQAKKKFFRMYKTNENIIKKLGNCIGEDQLNENDGISNKSNKEGHFTLLEYEGVDFEMRFNVVEKIL